MFSFLHHNLPDPILARIGPLAIHWYGFLMVAGGIAGMILILYLAKFYQQPRAMWYDLAFYWVLGAVAGARLYYVIYAWEFYQDNWLDILKIWQGGLAVHGVILGGLAALIIYCRVKKMFFWLIADLAAAGIAAGQIIGRWGNYFNQEIFGKPTSLPWGIPISPANRPAVYSNAEFFHPTFLYESLGSIAVVSIIVFLHWLRIKNRGRRIPPGVIFLSYLILYSMLRFGLEFLRTDYSPLIFGIRFAQIMSGLLAGVAVLLIIAAYRAVRSPKQ